MDERETRKQATLRPGWRDRLARVAGRGDATATPSAQVGAPGVRTDARSANSSRFLRPQDLKKYRNLLFAAKIVVEGFYSGRHRSPYHDFSAEFADYRTYVPGDEIRAIDWKAVARTDRLYVKLFRKETDMSAYLVVDRSASMAFAGNAGVTKLEYASYLAASLAYLMVRQGDRPSLALWRLVRTEIRAPALC